MSRCCSVLGKLVMGLGLVALGAELRPIAMAQQPPQGEAARETTGEESPVRTVRLRIVDAAGKPVSGASAVIQLTHPRVLTPEPSDDHGTVRVDVPSDQPILAVAAWKDQVGLDYRSYTLSHSQQADTLATAPQFPGGGEETLVLEGAAPLSVRVSDTNGQPLEGVRVYPWLLRKESENIELNLSYFTDQMAQSTGPDGSVTFAWIPRWQTSLITLWANAAGFVHQRGVYDPVEGSGEIEIILNRLVPIRGRVRHADGKPAIAIEVSASGAGYTFDGGHASTHTDELGAYELLVPPDQIYLIVVRDQQWAAAPQSGFAVLKDQPVEDKDFTLRPATRVHGRLINEDSKEPIPEQYVRIYQYGQDLHSMEGVELPNPENSRRYVQPLQVFSTRTDQQGQFEFFLGDGHFDIRPPAQDKVEKFEIAGETELVFEVTAKVHREVELVGTVVDSTTGHPIAAARIEGVPQSFADRDWQATTGPDGKFVVKRRETAAYVRAVSEDRRLAAITHVEATQDEVTLQLTPVATVTGRLLTFGTKEPWGGRVINYGVKVPDEKNQTWSYRFGGRTRTAEDGTFQLSGLVSGHEYSLQLEADEHGSIPRLTEVICKPGEASELGDLEAPPPYQPYVPPTLEQRISQAFEVAGTPRERHAKALELIDLVNQHLLVVFGTPADSRIHRLMQIRFEDPDYRTVSDEYRLMAIATDEANRDAANELANLLDESLDGQRGDFLLVLLDRDGNKVATADADTLCVDETLSKERLLDWLRSHLPQPPDARQLLEAALARAEREDKRVLVQETATWCGPCHLLSRYLEANRQWEQDYIWVKIDHRWSGARELMAELRDGADGGIPWFVILDAAGEKLATSNDANTQQNIGYPSSASGRQHFENIVRATRQRLSDEEVDQFIDALKPAQ